MSLPLLKPIFYPGKGFCLDLAKKGMNIVLVSRSKDKLDTVAKEIEEKYSVKTKVIAVDFTKDKDVRESIEEGIKVSFCNLYVQHLLSSQLVQFDIFQDLNVGVLVNNVGMSYEYPEYFLQVSTNDLIHQHYIGSQL